MSTYDSEYPVAVAFPPQPMTNVLAGWVAKHDVAASGPTKFMQLADQDGALLINRLKYVTANKESLLMNSTL